MPLVAHNALPSLQRLRETGANVVLPEDRAATQDIRELHIGLLNMMPDAALEATERQFFRLIGESNPQSGGSVAVGRGTGRRAAGFNIEQERENSSEQTRL